MVVISNFTPVVRHDYRIGVNEDCRYQEIFNSDDVNYWGSGVKNEGLLTTEEGEWNNKPRSIKVTLPPLSNRLETNFAKDRREQCQITNPNPESLIP